MSAGWTHYADLVLFKTWSGLKTETTKTYIGIAWWMLDPILYMGVFFLVFEVFLERGGPGFVNFLLVGLVFFRWFGNSLVNGSASIRQGHALMQQVYLPKLIFPLVSFLSDTFKFVCTLLLLFAFLWVKGDTPSVYYVALIPLLMLQGLLNLGVIFVAAAIIPIIPDIRYLISHVVMVALFTSGIFYRIDSLPPEIQEILVLNPLAMLITAYRTVLIDAQWPDFGALVPTLLFAVGLFVGGIVTISALDRRYPKIMRIRGS